MPYKYNIFTEELDYYESGSNSSTFLTLTDTPSSYSGQGSKGVRVNAGGTALEFYTIVDTDEKVKYNGSDASAGYLADKTVAGTGISLAESADKLEITNTDPDQTVSITGDSDIGVSGTYPNFTLSFDNGSGYITSVSGEDHSTLTNLDYASAGHTGFEPTVTKGDLTETTSNVLSITSGTNAIIGSGTTLEVQLASPSNGDTTHLSTADQIYDFVTGQGYLTSVAHTDLTDMPSSSNTDHDGRYYTETEIDTLLGDYQEALSDPTEITGASLTGNDGNTDRTYSASDVWLVFVDGVYLHKDVDYTYATDTITFKNQIWDSQNIGIVTK